MFDDGTLLYSVGLIAIAAALFSLLADRIKMPSIVAYVLAGLFLGPATGLVDVDASVELISEVGIALLLFLVGLELSLDKIKDVGKVALVAGLGQVVFTAAGGTGLALLLGFELIEAVFLGVALTFSSTVVVVKLLDQKGDLDSLYGRIAVGIFLVQDMVVIAALTLLAGLGMEGAEASTSQVATSLALAFGGTIVLLVAALLAARYVLPRPFGWAARSAPTLVIWSLCWCFLFVIASEVMHLSLEIGAFLAGISLAQLPYNDDLRRRVHPLMNFFIAVFFVSLGVRMELGAAVDQAGAAAVLSLFVLLGNPLIFIWLIARQGYSERTSFLTSMTVAQISEFSFIFAAMGVATGLVDEALLSLVAVVGLTTIVASAYMILYNDWLYERIRPTGILGFIGATDAAEDQSDHDPFDDHVIVVGMNALGRALVEHLDALGEQVVAVDTDPGKLQGLAAATIIGDAKMAATLEEAGLRRARLLVSALRIEDTNKTLVHRAARAHTPISVHAFDRGVAEDLRQLDVAHLLESKEQAFRLQLEHLQPPQGGQR